MANREQNARRLVTLVSQLSRNQTESQLDFNSNVNDAFTQKNVIPEPITDT